MQAEDQKLKINLASHLLHKSREYVQGTPIHQFRLDRDVMIPHKKVYASNTGRTEKVEAFTFGVIPQQ